MKKSFNIQEVLHETKLMQPSMRAFQRDQEHNLKHPGSVDLISTNKTNKLLTFIDKRMHDMFKLINLSIYLSSFEFNLALSAILFT